MGTINDILLAVNRIYFKAHLVEKEYHDFEYIRKKKKVDCRLF